MSSISTIHTACKNCAFAVYDNITQIGCSLDYIEKYKHKGATVLEVYDKEKEFYVINDKKCLGYRENKWFNKYNLENSRLETKIEKFKQENHLNYLLMVDLKNFDTHDLIKLAESIKNCKILPEKIIFVRYQNNNPVFTYDKIKEFIDNSKLSCKWRIQTMVTEELSHRDILHTCTNLNKGYRFILSINNPYFEIDNIIETANKIVYIDLDPIIAIADKNKYAILFSAGTYRWSAIVEKKNILDDEKNYIIV